MISGTVAIEWNRIEYTTKDCFVSFILEPLPALRTLSVCLLLKRNIAVKIQRKLPHEVTILEKRH